MKTENKEVQLAAYYFPNYHADPLNEARHGAGWTEWRLLQCARPRFPGHLQPKMPLWGYEDESDPKVMEKKARTAAEYGLSAFIFDWYWYEEGCFLSGGLEKGFFGGGAGKYLPFALMWANHDWTDIFPKKIHKPGELLYKGQISREKGYEAFDYISEKYFSRGDYWKVNGGFYFSVYELAGFIRTFGGLEGAKKAIEYFRGAAAKYGRIHLNCIYYETPILQGEAAYRDFNKTVNYLGFDSVTGYTWLHHHATDKLLFDYKELAEMSLNDYGAFKNMFTLPYYPNVSAGWDSSPRTVQSDTYGNYEEYPFSSVVTGNTPEAFGRALRRTYELVKNASGAKVITLNAWNEWSEGSYIEPDTRYGYAYLEEIGKIFGKRDLQ